MSTLKYQTVMSVKNPIPSKHIVEIEEASWRKSPVDVLKPFYILIDDIRVTIPSHTGLFASFTFIEGYRIFIFKTIDGKFVVINRGTRTKGLYELFSSHGRYVFDEIKDINFGGLQGLKKILSFSLKEYNANRSRHFDEWVKGTFLHPVGWGVVDLQGIDPEPYVIKQPEGVTPGKSFEISELFGPLPQCPPKKFDYRYHHDQWYVALCTDDHYRIWHYGSWLATADGKAIEVFKRFIPTVEPNYFYFLTVNNEELLIRAHDDYGAFERDLENARKGIDQNRINFFSREDGSYVFPGQRFKVWQSKDREAMVAGSLDQQRSLTW